LTRITTLTIKLGIQNYASKMKLKHSTTYEYSKRSHNNQES